MSALGAQGTRGAHRSQYDFIDGFARHMRDALPHTSFVGRELRGRDAERGAARAL